MNIQKYDTNFNMRKQSENGERIQYVIPNANFSLYGLSYDYENGCFCRMPETIAKTVSEGVQYFAKNTAGGRLRFSTDSNLCSTISSV